MLVSGECNVSFSSGRSDEQISGVPFPPKHKLKASGPKKSEPKGKVFEDPLPEMLLLRLHFLRFLRLLWPNALNLAVNPKALKTVDPRPSLNYQRP